jgi:hypothetical protein
MAALLGLCAWSGPESCEDHTEYCLYISEMRCEDHTKNTVYSKCRVKEPSCGLSFEQ